MDEKVREKLTEWNLSSFIETFRIAGIDFEIFEELDESILNQLFKTQECGFQRKFMKRYLAWRASMQGINENQSKKFKPNDFHEINLSNCPVSNNATHKVEEVETTNPTNQIEKPSSSDLSILSVTEMNDSILCIPIVKKNITELLATTIDGKIIQEIFKKTGHVECRTLTALIIKYEMEISNSYRIDKQRFIDLDKELNLIFANETNDIKVGFFYYPSTELDTRNTDKIRKKVRAGGVLYEKYLYIRKRLKKVNLISDDNILEVLTVGDIEESLTHANLDIEWLKNNSDPEDEVVDKWNKSFNNRPRCNNTLTFVDTYKGLQSSFSHKLLAQDFDKIYPESKDKLKNNWDSVSSDILKLIQNSKGKSKTLPFDEAVLNAGKENVLAFSGLFKTFQFNYRLKKGEEDPFKEHRPDILRHSFICHVETEKEFEDFQIIKKNFEDRNNCIEPYIVLIGSLVKESSPEVKVFIIINRLKYEIQSNSILDAVDYCFKCMTILRIEFPIPSSRLSTFFQQFFYEIPLKRSYTTVTNFMQLLKNSNAT